MDIAQVIKKPIITEKSTSLAAQNFYTFAVDPRATKPQIKEAVEKAFGVKVQKVRTANVRGKVRRVGPRRRLVRLGGWKKATVKVKEGQKIEFFEAGG